jgi:hypothetical protein
MNKLKRVLIAGSASVIMLSSYVGIAAAAGGPTTGPVAGPGCFGNWRAGSVQWLNESGYGPVGKNYFSVRAGDNSTINAENRAECEALIIE